MTMQRHVSFLWFILLSLSWLAPVTRSDLSIRVRPGSPAAASSTPSTPSNAENADDDLNELNDVMSVYSQSIAGNSSTETVQVKFQPFKRVTEKIELPILPRKKWHLPKKRKCGKTLCL